MQRDTPLFRRLISAALSGAIVVLSPGLPCFQAVAAQSSSGPRAPGAAPVLPAVAAVPAAPALPAGAPGLAAGLSTNALPAGIPAAAAPAVEPGARLPDEAVKGPVSAAVAAAPGIAARTAAVPATARAAQEAPVAPAAAASAEALSDRLSEVFAAAGDPASIPPAQSHELGGRLEDALTGGLRAPASGREPAAKEAELPALEGGSSAGVFLARPAGESISAAAQAFSSGPRAPAPPSGTGAGDGSGPSGSSRGPLWPRLFSMALSLLPAALLGAPLIVGGSVLGGSLVIAASLGVAALPFMGAGWPKALRSVPGLALAALGLGTLGLSLFAASGAGIAMGAMAALGGWGLTRFARNPEKFDRWDSGEILVTFFGAFGSVAGAGLALLHPAGAVLSIVSYALIAAPVGLFIHLPGWVGEAIKTGFHGLFLTVRDSYQASTSVRRDTLLFDRLRRFTEAAYKRSAWNGLWLGLVVWLPVLVVEAAKIALGFATGLALSAARLPALLLWGASHELKADSRPTKFFASWARSQMAQSKGVSFNRLEAVLIPAANSRSRIVSFGGAIEIAALQLGWHAYMLARAVVSFVAGFLKAFLETGEPYDAAKHDPDRFALPSERAGLPEREHEKPGDAPGGPIGPLLSKLIAASVPLLPVYFLTIPILLETSLLPTGLFAGAALAAAAMPLMPASLKFPMRLRKLPGYLLVGAGLAALFLVPWSASLALNLNGVAAGLIAALGGLGLVNYAEKLAKGETTRYPVDDPEYIGGFVGVVGTLTALGLSVLGPVGPLAIGLTIAGYLSSLFLLAHLPRWLWTGVGVGLQGLGWHVASLYKVARFWTKDTDFDRHMKAWSRGWLEKSVWNGAWLWIPWLAVALNKLADALLSFVLGLGLGAVAFPMLWAWGASYDKNPDGKAARFFAGFARSVLTNGLGSKKAVFDRWAKGLLPALDAETESGRPTAGAVLALIGARFVQLAWLLRAVLGAPVLLVVGLRDGIKNASGAKTPAEDGRGDADRPGNIL